MRAHPLWKIAAGLFCAALGVGPLFAAEARQSPAAQTAPTAVTQTTANTSSSATKPTVKKATAKTRVIRKRKPRQKVQMAPTPARIAEIQSALAAQGTYKAPPNGKWDGATIQAMRDFQASHGITVTGKLDAPTLQKLGLGSEIAGRAAPLPPQQTPAGNPSAGQQQTP